MPRGLLIFLLGIVVAVAAFGGYYFSRTAPQRFLVRQEAPELAWLKQEFQLSDSEFQRVSELHLGYLPQCEEMCARIAGKNAELKGLLEQARTVTPEIEAKIQEANDLRVECHKKMLAHFFEVSRAMPPEQGRRYLEWVQQRTLLEDSAMMVGKHGTHE